MAFNRLRHLGRRSRFERDLEEEVRFHIESRAEELEAAGLSPSHAMAQARREFGSVVRAGEDSRAAWQFQWIEDLAADLRHACRSFRRSPGFTLAAVISLALGMGANIAVFNAIYSLLWKPLPVADPDRLVSISTPSAKRRDGSDVPLEFVRQLRRADIFAGVVVTAADGLSFSAGSDRAERIIGEAVSGDYFDVLGIRPIIGQPFTPAVRDGKWAAEVVLSHSFWKRRFAGDPGVIGRTIRLNTYPFTIVGISPPGFTGLGRGMDFELRLPMLPDGREIDQMALIGARASRRMYTGARLKPGVVIRQAEAAANAQLKTFLRATSIPGFRPDGRRSVRLEAIGRGDNGVLKEFHAPLYVLFTLVAIVLLVGCVNVANLLLARAAARAREFAVRASIGAGRMRLVRQMLAESLLLALLAGGCAVAVGHWVAGLLIHFLPQTHLPISLDLQPDAVVLLFTFVLSLFTGVLVGVAPAVQATRGDLAGTLKSDSAASIGRQKGAGFRELLVASQVAFSLVLLIAAGVFFRTVLDLRPTDYGAHPVRVLLFTMKPQLELYTDTQKRNLVAELVRRVSELPDVQAAGVAENGPLGPRGGSDLVESDRREPVHADTDWVTPGLFDAAGIRRIAGRDFTAADRPGSSLVAIVNESLARGLFGSANPIGRSFILDKDRRSFEVIGVVRDSRYYDIHASPQPAAWFAFQDASPYMPTLHVRTSSSNTAAMIAAVRQTLDTLDKGFPVFNVKTLEVRIDDSLARERMVANLAAAIGMLALALAAAGLYGVLAYSVSRRTPEIGIRMALGSNTRSVLWMVAKEALLLMAAGSIAGVIMSLAAHRLLLHQLPGISTIDAPVLAACAAILLIVAAAAIAVPAIRACRVDPLTALRHE